MQVQQQVFRRQRVIALVPKRRVCLHPAGLLLQVLLLRAAPRCHDDSRRVLHLQRVFPAQTQEMWLLILEGRQQIPRLDWKEWWEKRAALRPTLSLAWFCSHTHTPHTLIYIKASRIIFLIKFNSVSILTTMCVSVFVCVCVHACVCGMMWKVRSNQSLQLCRWNLIIDLVVVMMALQ